VPITEPISIGIQQTARPTGASEKKSGDKSGPTDKSYGAIVDMPKDLSFLRANNKWTNRPKMWL